jgi:ribosomal-protein-alanine N-acetyltransferase
LTDPVLVRPASLVDLERITWLETTCFADPWPAPLLRGEFVHPGAVLLVAGSDIDAPGGYACLRLGGGEAELLRVAVAPAARRQGLATALITSGLARVGRAGARRCHLEVRVDNAPARAVYERLGFTATGTRPRYYRDGTDALIYSRLLTAAEAGAEESASASAQAGTG